MGSVEQGDRVRVFVGTWVRRGIFPAGEPKQARSTYVVRVENVVRQPPALHDVAEWLVRGDVYWCWLKDIRPLVKASDDG